MQYEAGIIGGGLAGLSLAVQAARAGFSTILFEKESYPFHKVCGEYISMESWDFLEQLGLSLGSLGLPQIKRLQLTDVSGRIYQFPLDLGGFGISRFRLDEALYQLALQQGVTIMTDTRVTDVKLLQDNFFEVSTAAQTFYCKVAAGAFGKRSNLDVQWQRLFTKRKPDASKQYIAVKYHVRYPHDRQVIALHNFDAGYCGFSSIENGLSCLCYLTTAAHLRNHGQSISQMEAAVLHRNPVLRKLLTTAEHVFDHPLAIAQISFAPRLQVERHILMLGDAAGLITPLCGNGMSMALHASKLAWQAIFPFLMGRISRSTMEDDYAVSWHRQFSRRLQIGRQVQQYFGRPLMTSVFLRTMKALPPVANWVIRQTHGAPF